MADKDELKISRRPEERRILRRYSPSFSSLLDEFFDDFFSSEPILAKRERTLIPKVDIINKPSEIIVQAEIPGIDKKDLDIEVGDDYLTIKGEKKASEEHKEEDYFYKESFHGKFVREISLPEKIKTDAAKASYENGILKVVIPKSEESKVRKIEVG